MKKQFFLLLFASVFACSADGASSSSSAVSGGMKREREEAGLTQGGDISVSVQRTAYLSDAATGNRQSTGGSSENLQRMQSMTAVILQANSGRAPKEVLSFMLSQMCQHGQLEDVKYLVAQGADINFCDKNDCSFTPLHCACRYGHLGVVQFLVECKNVDINAKDEWGQTPLHEACASGRADVVERLVQCDDVDVNAKDNSGATALYQPLRAMEEHILRILLECGRVDLSAVCGDGKTPFHMFCEFGCPGWVKLLASHEGVDVNALCASGDTPLALACRTDGEDEWNNKNFSVVKFLVESAGAEIRIQDLKVAREVDHMEAFHYLLSKKLPSLCEAPCAICLTDKHVSLRLVPCCFKPFCADCIAKVIACGPICPHCRDSLSEDELIEVPDGAEGDDVSTAPAQVHEACSSSSSSSLSLSS